jgi:hypothetical protein
MSVKEVVTRPRPQKLDGRCRVDVYDLDGQCRVESEDELVARLRSVRREADGAFVLDHGEQGSGPSLWVHIHGDAAYLHYFPDMSGRRAGYAPDRMWPHGPREPVRFRLVGGSAGDSICVPWWQLVPIEVAYGAAVEFLHSPSLPASVSWMEL